MEVLNQNVRQRPYLRRKAKSKNRSTQPIQKRPQKKKRPNCDDVENNKKKRRKKVTVEITGVDGMGKICLIDV